MARTLIHRLAGTAAVLAFTAGGLALVAPTASATDQYPGFHPTACQYDIIGAENTLDQADYTLDLIPQMGDSLGATYLSQLAGVKGQLTSGSCDATLTPALRTSVSDAVVHIDSATTAAQAHDWDAARAASHGAETSVAAVWSHIHW
jgi:hypothetical protein